MPYYVLKTGMSMYDLERAYGLGLLVSKLSYQEVRVFDKGLYYEIHGAVPANMTVEGKMADILSLLATHTPAWNQVLATTTKQAREKKKARAFTVLKKRAKEMLHRYNSLDQPPKKPKELLTAPLELAATKGFRETVRNQRYHEGTGFKIPEEDWVLALIGSLHFLSWKFVGESVSIVPCPDSVTGVDVSHAASIKAYLDQEKSINRVNVLCTVVHSAVRLYIELFRRKRDETPWRDTFSGFVYGSLVGAAQQLKPKTGGFFSVELFEKLLEVDNGADVLEHFDHMFRVGNLQGQESLAMSLADFLNNPILENYSTLLKLYGRSLLNEKVRIKAPPENTWMEVMKYVRT